MRIQPEEEVMQGKNTTIFSLWGSELVFGSNFCIAAAQLVTRQRRVLSVIA